MRFIRSFVILVILVLSLAAASPIYAADSYFNVSGCPDDPAQLCTASGDGVNTNIPLTGFWYEAGATIADLVGERVMSWAGKLWPKDDRYLIGKEKLNTYASQVQTASDTDLNPAQLQEIEQHDETPKPFSMTSRLCVYDPSDGTLIGKGIVSTTTVKSDEVTWIRPKVEGDRRLSSFTTRYVQESQDFGLQYIMIHQDAALPCDSKVEGEEKWQKDKASQDDNTYGENLGSNVMGVTIHIISSLIRMITHDDGSTSHENVPVSAEIVGTGQNPFTGHDSALSAGCATPSDLDDVTYATAEQKQKLCETGGHTNAMYRPDAIDPTYISQLDADDPNQQWVQTVTGDEPIAKNSNAFAARVEAAGDYMNCTLMPADYQNRLPDAAACNKNWVSGATATTTTGGCNAPLTDSAVDQAIAKAESMYGIPSGMLRAIYEIEALDLGIANPSDYVCLRNTDIPGHIAGDTSAGLMQLNNGAYASVTCGNGMEDDVAQCSQKQAGQLSRCDINDTFELAARVLLLRVGKWDNSGCKPTGSITTNSEIYTAACRYGTGFAPTPLTSVYAYNLPRPKRSNGAMNYCDIVCNKMGRCGPYYPPQVAYPPNW
jgi:hypothetical protein